MTHVLYCDPEDPVEKPTQAGGVAQLAGCLPNARGHGLVPGTTENRHGGTQEANGSEIQITLMVRLRPTWAMWDPF